MNNKCARCGNGEWPLFGNLCQKCWNAWWKFSQQVREEWIAKGGDA